MTRSLNHLTDWQIEQLAEGELPEAERQTASAHLDSCGRCSAEVDSYRILFTSLSTLPRYAPSDNFSEAVLARVNVAPRTSPVLAWLRRFAPTTRRGWGVLLGLAALPAAPVVMLVGWLLSQPLVSVGSLWGWTLAESQAAAADAFGVARGWVGQAANFDFVNLAAATASTVPTGAVVAIIVFLAIAIPLSAWSLHRLLRTPTGNVAYAN
ncbi:MAG TPA: hypothetical protein VFI91_08715 [Longimicrobiaceae bacterium]|nr:hypothetical protein [Longimicrobiaceae bacterium]